MSINQKISIKLKELANCIRFLAIDAVEKAKSGHPGMPMGMADIATVLFKDHLKFDPKNPKWLNRDRLIISNGHGSMLLYACLYTDFLTIVADIAALVPPNNFEQLNKNKYSLFLNTLGINLKILTKTNFVNSFIDKGNLL